MWRVQSSILCDLDPQVQGQIMHFLLNAFTPKPLDVATSKFVGY